jgi:hypothetical protein
MRHLTGNSFEGLGIADKSHRLKFKLPVEIMQYYT